jgi:hypothetical protein
MKKPEPWRLAATLVQVVDRELPQLPLADRDALLRSLRESVDRWCGDEQADRGSLRVSVHAAVDAWDAAGLSPARSEEVDDRLVAEIESIFRRR